MAFPINTVPGPQQRTGIMLSCHGGRGPHLYTHADMNSLIFHSTGQAACPYQKNTFLQKKSLETAVRQDNNRIIHSPFFLTFDSLTLFFFYTFLSISLLCLLFLKKNVFSPFIHTICIYFPFCKHPIPLHHPSFLFPFQPLCPFLFSLTAFHLFCVM